MLICTGWQLAQNNGGSVEANKTEANFFSILVEQGEMHTKKVAELAKITQVSRQNI